MDEAIEEIRRYVMDSFSSRGSHGLDHILRVAALCEVIGREEHADRRILIPAALFHDVGRPEEKDRGIPHEEAGARIAEDYLRRAGYAEDSIRQIVHAIRTHRYRSQERPGTLEARILSDADKLDAMGAVGIARTFIRAGEHNGGIEDAVDHMHDKLLKLGDLMHTGTAKRLAGERNRFLHAFLETLERETGIPDSPL